MAGPVIRVPPKGSHVGQDLIISFLSSVPASVKSQFATPPLTLAVPAAPLGKGRIFYNDYLNKFRDGQGNVIPGLFKAAGGGTGRIGRVAVIGFSNGVDSGVSQVLAARDASKIDFVGAFDGIHGSFLPGTTKVVPASYAKWIAYAKLAASTKPSEDPSTPLMVITHSSVEPTFPSTTETAAYIWTQVVADKNNDYETVFPYGLGASDYPSSISIPSVDTAGSGKQMPKWSWSSFKDGLYVTRVANGLTILGWGDPGKSRMGRIMARCRDKFNDTADHVYQGQYILPQILTAYLVPRWNPICSDDGGSTDARLSGLGGGACVRLGRSYSDSDAAPLEDPSNVSFPTSPPQCPYPLPGETITGSPSSSCSTSPTGQPPPSSAKPKASAFDIIAPWVVVGGCAFGAYRGIRYLRQSGRI